MNLHGILCLCAMVGLPQLGRADLPFTPQALGTVQATIDFCARTDPSREEKYQEHAKSFVQGLPEKEVNAARRSPAYKAAYESASQALEKAPKQDGDEACHGFIEG
jgi:hypothetical protein